MKHYIGYCFTWAALLAATCLPPSSVYGSCGKEAVQNLTLSQMATITSPPEAVEKFRGGVKPWIAVEGEIPVSHISQLTQARLICITRCYSGGGGLRITAADGTEYLIGAPDASKNWPGVYTYKSAKGAFMNLWYSTDEGGQEWSEDFSFLNFYGTLEPLSIGATYEYSNFKVTNGYLFTPIAGYNGEYTPRFMSSGHTYLIATEGYYLGNYQTTGWTLDPHGLSHPMPHWAIIDITPGYSGAVLAWINSYAFQYIIYTGALPYTPTYLDCQDAYNRIKASSNWNAAISKYGSAEIHCAAGWGGSSAVGFVIPNYLVITPATPSIPVSIYDGLKYPNPNFWKRAGMDGYDIDLTFLKDYIPADKELKSIGMVGWAAKDQSAITLSGLANLTTGAPAQLDFWNQTLTLDKSRYQYFWDEANSRYIMGVEDGNDGDSNYNDVVLSLYVSPDVAPLSPQTVTIDSNQHAVQQPAVPASAITLGDAPYAPLSANSTITFMAAGSQVGSYIWNIRNDTQHVDLMANVAGSETCQATLPGNSSGNVQYTVSVYAPGNDDYLESVPATARVTVAPPAANEVIFKVKSVPTEAYKMWFSESPETTIKVRIK